MGKIRQAIATLFRDDPTEARVRKLEDEREDLLNLVDELNHENWRLHGENEELVSRICQMVNDLEVRVGTRPVVGH